MKTVYIEYPDSSYHTMFWDMGYAITRSVEEADFVCFTGGSDVSPSIYGHPAHPTTHCDEWRDAKEERLFMHCIANDLPMVGICRGAQFLNVMSGGSMYQDVSDHCWDHYIEDVTTKKTLLVSSTHHQMMRPSSTATLIGVSYLEGKRTRWDGEKFISEVSDVDYEVVLYEHTRCLCFQPHPEFTSDRYKDMRDYFAFHLAALIN